MQADNNIRNKYWCITNRERIRRTLKILLIKTILQDWSQYKYIQNISIFNKSLVCEPLSAEGETKYASKSNRLAMNSHAPCTMWA